MAADSPPGPAAHDVPFISVIVLAFNGLEHLKICLPTLLAQTYPSNRLEIIVVDNASGDGSAELVARDFPSVRLIRNAANLGFARGNTIGAQAARGDFVAFLNQDTRADRLWLAELVAPLLAARRAGDRSLICTGAKMLSWDGSVIDFAGGRMNAIGKATQVGSGLPDGPAYAEERETLFACGGAMLIDRQVYLEVGGFDDDYFVLFEDVDLGWRLWVLGYRVVLAPKAIVYHRLHASVDQVHDVRKQLIFERNALFTLLKNYDDEQLGRAVPVSLLLTLYRVLGELHDAGVRASDFDIRNHHRTLADRLPLTAPAAGLLLAIDEVFQQLPSLMAKRQAIQNCRQRSDREIFRLFGGPLEPLDHQPGFATTSYLLSATFGLDRSFSDVSRRILVVTAAPPWTALSGSSDSQRATLLTRALQSAGHDVIMACHELALTSGGDEAGPGLLIVTWTEASLTNLIVSHRPDAILACGSEVAFWIDLDSAFRRIPVIVDLSSSEVLDSAGGARMQRAVAALARADIVTCATPALRDSILTWWDQHSLSLPDPPQPLVIVPIVLPG
jgi:hypothetical protein